MLCYGRAEIFGAYNKFCGEMGWVLLRYDAEGTALGGQRLCRPCSSKKAGRRYSRYSDKEIRSSRGDYVLFLSFWKDVIVQSYWREYKCCSHPNISTYVGTDCIVKNNRFSSPTEIRSRGGQREKR